MDAVNGPDAASSPDELVVTAITDNAIDEGQDNAAQAAEAAQNGRESTRDYAARQGDRGQTSPISALPSSSLPTRDSSPTRSRLPYNAAALGSTATVREPRPLSRDVFNSLDYPYSNVALMDFAEVTPSTSTAIFHFTVDPPKPLKESFFRTRVDESDQYNAVPDTDFGYHATPEEVEAYRLRELEKGKAREAAIARAEAARLKAEQKATGKYQKRKYRRNIGTNNNASAGAADDRDAASVADTASRQVSPAAEEDVAADTTAVEPSLDQTNDGPVMPSTAPEIASTNASGDSDADDEHDDEEKKTLHAPPMSATPSAAGSVASAAEFVPTVSPAKRSSRHLDVLVSSKSRSTVAPRGRRRSKSESPADEKPKPTATEPQRRRRQVRHSDAGSAVASPAASTSVKLKLTGPICKTQSSSAVLEIDQLTVRAPTANPKPAPSPSEPEDAEEAAALASGALRLHVQDKPCTDPAYARKSSCFRCMSRSDVGFCRFMGRRTFKLDVNGVILDSGKLMSVDKPDMPIRVRDIATFTGPLSSAGANWNRAGVVKPLVRLLEEAIALMDGSARVARMPRDPRTSYICDTCLRTTVFVRHMCNRCGRIACAKCLNRLGELCEAEDEADSPMELATARAHYTYDTLRRVRCLASKNKLTFGRDETHTPENFSLLATYDKVDLEELLGMAKEFIREGLAPKLEDEEPGHVQPDVIFLDATEEPTVDKATEVWRAFNRERSVVIKGQDLSPLSTWTADTFVQNCEDLDSELMNLKTGDSGEVSAKAFFRNWGHLRRNKGAKLELFPVACYGSCRSAGLHDRYHETMPRELQDMLLPGGKANLLAQWPANSFQPETEPRYNFVWAEHNSKDTPSNNLQVAHADFVNLVFDAWPREKCKVKWLVYPPSARDPLRPEVQLQTARKLKVNASKYASAHDDALFTGAMHWTRHNVEVAKKAIGVKPYEFTSGLGDVVLIPAGSIFQMTTETDILSMEHYFLTSASVDNTLQVHEEARQQNKTNMLTFEDDLRIEMQLLWVWVTAQARWPLPPPLEGSHRINLDNLDDTVFNNGVTESDADEEPIDEPEAMMAIEQA
ncbi:hypothetical protein OIV83_000681 [Microbotryomycetes sp. JL201]|nr:hypothetical protein OIV83_000681 [Microbotryomycetes sp. JL201]